MAHGFRLAEAGKAKRRFTFLPAEARREGFRFIKINAGHVIAAGFENEAFFHRQGAVAGEGFALPVSYTHLDVYKRQVHS